jgi:pimeloyl-ACP methyl ester carboxylesterase
VCSPYFSPQPRRQDVAARAVSRPGVTEHFLRHEYLQHDYRDRVGTIRCPTLLLGGELDPIVPIQEIEDMASRMQPGVATVVRFPDAGHGVGGQPNALSVVRDFVLDDA